MQVIRLQAEAPASKCRWALCWQGAELPAQERMPSAPIPS